MRADEFSRKVYKKIIKLSDRLTFNDIYNDSILINPVIPCVEKDAQTLPFVIDGIRNNVKNKLGEIHIVSPEFSPLIKNIAKDKNCIFVDERQVIPFDATNFQYAVNGFNRKGWVLQQLIKLNSDKALGLSKVLIVDSDTVFVSPQHFIKNNKVVFSIADEYHQPYFDMFTKLLGLKVKSIASFTSHHMLFETEVLQSLKRDIEAHCNCSWYEAIIKNLDPLEMSCFCEYETYSNYFFLKHREKMRAEYFWNKSLVHNGDIEKILQNLPAEKIKAVSFHSYNQK